MGHVCHIREEVEVLHLVVALEQALNGVIVLSGEGQIVVQKNVKGKDHWLLYISMLEGNSSLNFIH